MPSYVWNLTCDISVVKSWLLLHTNGIKHSKFLQLVGMFVISLHGYQWKLCTGSSGSSNSPRGTRYKLCHSLLALNIFCMPCLKASLRPLQYHTPYLVSYLRHTLLESIASIIASTWHVVAVVLHSASFV